MSTIKVQFEKLNVGDECVFHGVPFRKTSEQCTYGRKLSNCKSNCISLHNNHECVIADKAIVVVDND